MLTADIILKIKPNPWGVFGNWDSADVRVDFLLHAAQGSKSRRVAALRKDFDDTVQRKIRRIDVGGSFQKAQINRVRGTKILG